MKSIHLHIEQGTPAPVKDAANGISALLIRSDADAMRVEYVPKALRIKYAIDLGPGYSKTIAKIASIVHMELCSMLGLDPMGFPGKKPAEGKYHIAVEPEDAPASPHADDRTLLDAYMEPGGNVALDYMDRAAEADVMLYMLVLEALKETRRTGDARK